MVKTPVHRRLNRHRRQYSQGMDPKLTCPLFSHARAQMQHVQRPQRIPPPQHVQHPQHVSLPESAQQQDDGVLGRMMSMLERVLARVELHSPEGRQKRPSCFSSREFVEMLITQPCLTADLTISVSSVWPLVTQGRTVQTMPCPNSAWGN